MSAAAGDRRIIMGGQSRGGRGGTGYGAARMGGFVSGGGGTAARGRGGQDRPVGLHNRHPMASIRKHTRNPKNNPPPKKKTTWADRAKIKQ